MAMIGRINTRLHPLRCGAQAYSVRRDEFVPALDGTVFATEYDALQCIIARDIRDCKIFEDELAEWQTVEE